MKYLLLLIAMCLSCAYADVSELLYKPEPHTEEGDKTSDSKPSTVLPQPIPEHLEARPYNVLTNSIGASEYEPETLPHFYETVQVEEPAGVPFTLVDESVGIVDTVQVHSLGGGEAYGQFVAIEPAIRTVQLATGHADYQGPYVYQKPKVPLEYVVPVAPKLKDDATLVSNEYLPPRLASAENLAKRHATYFIRRI
ncbi:uncharacterized protein LOC129723849 [Wyeomyia smithii]|uniref:uncharacterized protein LOC129723849 n=1 Tax=Wyeomyia smithii TaxID=174621 RepID=UPI002467CDBB|nr:uncharacterized protein LOC129723849 [Wyeomyia smithii]